MDLNDNEQNKSDKEKFLLNIEEIKRQQIPQVQKV